MKRVIGIVVMSVFVGAGAFAQTTPNFSKVESAFQSFSNDVASSLPYASNIGLNWSSAYIGKFPHFGAGLAAGFVTIPTTGFSSVTSALGVGNVLPSQLSNPNLGLPLPAYVAEARIGGFVLPFDIGLKAGFIPKQANLGAILPSGTNIQFHLFGAQVRYQLVKQKLLTPEVSVGVGVNHFDGTIGATVGSPITVASVPYSGGSYDITATAPQVAFDWNSNSVDASIEVSKKILLLFTPYVGAGVSYGFSTAGGGINSTIEVNGQPITQTEINNINSYLSASGQSTINFSGTGFSIKSKANGWSARAFGGMSINIAFLKIDGTVMYNLLSKKLGATVGTRLQF